MRIALVNDVTMALEVLRRAIAREGTHQVAWMARDGAEAVAKCADDVPDLILMDLMMPVMDGAEATRRIMLKSPCAILVVTATVDGHIDKVFEAMGYGALDAVNTPNLTDPESTARLLAKIQQIGRLVQHGSAAPKASEGMSGSMPSVAFPGTTARNLILLGASTGGPDALGTVLKDLPPSLDAAIVIVQHVDHVFAQGLADWLGTHTGRRVELAAVGTAPLAGHAYLAAGEDHLVLTRQGTFAHQREPQDSFYRPSVDVLFESAARHWPQKGAAALLTGMGRDGARGLLELKEAGWLTLAQDEGSCVVYGMPKAAVQLGAPRRVLPLNMIGNALAKCFAAGGRSV